MKMESHPEFSLETLIDRRGYLKKIAAAIAVYQLSNVTVVAEALATTLKPDFENWIRAVEIACLEVRDGKIKPTLWQTKMDRFHNRVPLEDVLRFTDLEKVLKVERAPMKEKVASIHEVPWPKLGAESPAEIPFGHKLFIYRKGSVTPPHAHNHLVSAHMILKGKFRVRTFDRVQDTAKGMVIKATRDETMGVGSVITMSDYKDNVHWFEALEENSVTFDIPVPDIEPAKQYRHPAAAYNQIFIDPTVPVRADGKLEAPIIPFAEALRRFA